MTNKIKQFTIKLPSSTNVNPTSVWGVLKVIANTGKVFLEENLIKLGSPINEKNLFRVLSYLKYLGVIYERREKENRNGKEERFQRWYQKDTSKVTDLFYSLKAGRDNEAKKFFFDILASHDLFLGIKEELMKSNPSPTELDLEHYFRKKSPGKSPPYYQHGVKFVIGLLSFVGLLKKEGNSFVLISEENSKKDRTDLTEETEERKNLNKEPDEIKLKKSAQGKYSVRIFGEGADFSFALNNPSDIDDVEALLNIIRKKLT